MIKMAQDYEKHPKVALFLPNLGIGGAERVFVTLSKQFVRMGLQVDLVLAEKTGPLLSEVDPGVNIVDLAAHHTGEPTWRFGLRALLSLARYLRTSPPDVLLSTLTGANLTAIVARVLSLRTFRLVIREAATLANVRPGLRLSIMRRLYPLVDRVVVLTDFMKDELLTSLGLPNDQITVIGNPVDAEKIQVLATDLNLTRSAQEISPFAIVVGRLVEQKDFVTAIHAVALVNAEKPFDLAIIGEGPQRDELKILARSLGIQDRVHFLEYQSNPYPWLKQADIFILSSKWEGYPNVLLEAMSLGCRIVAAEYDPSLRLILSTYPEQLQRIVGVGNKIKMADAILELAQYDKVDSGMGANAIQQTINEYLVALDVNCNT